LIKYPLEDYFRRIGGDAMTGPKTERGILRGSSKSNFRIIFVRNGSNKMEVEMLGEMTEQEAFDRYLKWADENSHGDEVGQIKYSEVVKTVVF
jgi:hypothetical protein